MSKMSEISKMRKIGEMSKIGLFFKKRSTIWLA